ncbi:helix-turn-helix transcriptional regulator [Sphingomonas lycopersici]|uniref:helix-turn-helix transcriptional regulator n=1 Tax=Sphingomonas lycopersici TaxID=2951807 RepID=UPI002237167F|nr:RNA polymerase subunit sigma-70 [Sphingomonas lycopersici]
MARSGPFTAVEDPFTKLNDRHRLYLWHVTQNRKSKEIAKIEGVSPRAVDKILLQAKDILGAADRFEAARMFSLHASGVEGFYPGTILPSPPELWPLPSPLPTAEGRMNWQNWRHLTVWTAIIAIAAPLTVGTAALLLFVLSLLIGANPQ